MSTFVVPVCGYGCCWSNKYLCHFVTHIHRSVSHTTLLGTPAELLQQISDKAEADLGLQTGPTHQGGAKAEIGDSEKSNEENRMETERRSHGTGRKDAGWTREDGQG